MNWDRPGFLPPEHPLFKWIYLANITWMSLMGSFSAAAISVANLTIQGAIGVNTTYVRWDSLIYFLGLVVAVPLSSPICLTYGYKKTFFYSTISFMIANFLIASTTTYALLVSLRFLAGLSVGLFYPVSLSMIAEAFDKKKLSLGVAIYTAGAFGGGLFLALSLGGIIADHLGWRPIFLCMGAFSLPSLVTTWLIHIESEKRKLPPFDFIGYFSFLFFLGAVIVLTDNAKAPWNTLGWHSPFAVILIALALISLTLFLIQELTTPHPLFILKHFRLRPFFLGAFAIFFVGATVFGTQTTITSLLERNFGYSKTMAGLVASPFGLSLGLFSACSGLLNRWIHNRYLVLTGLACLALSCFLNHSITQLSTHWDFIQILLLRGLGIGLSLGPTTALALSYVPKETLSKGAMTLTALRQFGGALGGNLIGLIQAERTPFHQEIFSTHVYPNTPVFQKLMDSWKAHLFNTYPDTDIQTLGEELVRTNVLNQAEILSQNDGYFLIGICITMAFLAFSTTITCFLIKTFLKNRGKRVH